VAVVLAGWAIVLLAPVVALAAPSPWRWIFVGACVLAHVGTALFVAGRARRRILPALLLPLGRFIIAALLVRSARACRQHGGVVWRGTTYALPRLRELRRVR
jgi:hypothetical protein